MEHTIRVARSTPRSPSAESGSRLTEIVVKSWVTPTAGRGSAGIACRPAVPSLQQIRDSLAGRLTQRLECHPHTVEVTGSNPVPPKDDTPDGRDPSGVLFLG
jgi:hypothetical protein